MASLLSSNLSPKPQDLPLSSNGLGGPGCTCSVGLSESSLDGLNVPPSNSLSNYPYANDDVVRQFTSLCRGVPVGARCTIPHPPTCSSAEDE